MFDPRWDDSRDGGDDTREPRLRPSGRVERGRRGRGLARVDFAQLARQHTLMESPVAGPQHRPAVGSEPHGRPQTRRQHGPGVQRAGASHDASVYGSLNFLIEGYDTKTVKDLVIKEVHDRLAERGSQYGLVRHDGFLMHFPDGGNPLISPIVLVVQQVPP